MREGIGTSSYLQQYWQEIVLPGLAAELRDHSPGPAVGFSEGKAGSTVRMAFAWKLTGEDKYARAAWENLVGTLQEAPSGMLIKGSRIIEWVTVLSWLDGWDGLVTDKVAQARTLIADLTESTSRYFNPGSFGSLDLNRGENWDAQVVSGLGVGACYLLGHPRAEEWLKQAERSAAAWLDRRAFDGGHCEGTINYQLYSLWNMTRLADVLREHGRLNLFAHEGLCKMLEFVVYTLAPDGRVPGFNDSERTNFHKRNASDTLLLKAGVEYGDPVFLWAYRRVREDLPDYFESFPYVLLYYPEDETAKPPAYVDSMAFPRVGWVTMRNGWSRDSTHLVVKAGPWGGWHDHFDRSTFELVGKGVPLAVDAGCGSYDDRMDWFRRTESHNVVLIDGKDQFPIGGRIVRFFSSAVADFAVLDCRRALTDRDGGMGTGYLRHVLYDKQKDRFVFFDSISGAKRCTWLLHSRGSLQTEAQRALWTTKEGVRLSAKFLSPQVAIGKKVGKAAGVEEYGEPAQDIEYIAATPAGTENEFVVLLEPLADGQDPSRVEAPNPAAGYFLLGDGDEMTHLKVNLRGASESQQGLKFHGVAALVGTEGQRPNRLAVIGATQAELNGQTLFQSSSAADIAVSGFEGQRLTGKLHVWGQLAEVPILTCDGLAASVFQERPSRGNVEARLYVPWRPAEVLLGRETTPFHYDKDTAHLHLKVQEIGQDVSLEITGEA